MTIVGQPPASPALQKALKLLAQGQAEEADSAIRKPALKAKAAHGSGSHPLALAYADMARFHLLSGDADRAATEFLHASRGPMPRDKQERTDRLAFMFGYAAALSELGRMDEAEKVLRQCLAFARNLHGGQTAAAIVAQVPLADLLFRTDRAAEAAKLAVETYDALWKLGDPLITYAVGCRAEAWKLAGKVVNPFADLNELPDDLVGAAVATTLARAGKGDSGRIRAVLGDLLTFVEKKYGDGNPYVYDTLATINRHEEAAGAKADDRIRRTAVRKAVWSFAVRRVPGGLLANLEVGFEPEGTIHLAPHLSREPSQVEAAQLEEVFNQAVDELYSRPAI